MKQSMMNKVMFGLMATSLTVLAAQPTWTTRQIGGGPTGSITVNAEPGSFTVQAGGNDIWDTQDEFTFHYTEVVGDFDVRVQVTYIDQASRWTKAGVMARESLNVDSRMAFAKASPTGTFTDNCGANNGAADVSFMYRTWIPGAGNNGGQHEDRIVSDPGYPTYQWLRLVRQGNVFRAYASQDGVNWAGPQSQDTSGWKVPVGGANTPFNPLALVGIAASRHGCSRYTLARCEYRNYSDNAASITAAFYTPPANANKRVGETHTFNPLPVGWLYAYDFKWQKNGVDIPGANSRTYTTPPLSYADNGAQYTIIASNRLNGTVASATATINVAPEPWLMAAGTGNNTNAVLLTFSQPMDPTIAANTANYQLNNNAQVLSAQISPLNPSKVVLHTTTLSNGLDYVVIVHNLTDTNGVRIDPDPQFAAFLVRYVQPSFFSDFSSMPPNSSIRGNASITGGLLQLTPNQNGQQGAFVLNQNFAGADPIDRFFINFKVRIGDSTSGTCHADGMAFSMATDLPDTWSEEGGGTGLSLCFDTYDNGGGEAPAFDVKWGGNTIAHVPLALADLITYPDWVNVQMNLDPESGLFVKFGNRVVLSNYIISGFVPMLAPRLGFSARTGGCNDRHQIDDLSVDTLYHPGPATVSIPATVSVIQNNPASFHASFDGNWPYTYRVLSNGVVVASGTTLTKSIDYTITTNAAVANDGDVYRVEVANDFGTDFKELTFTVIPDSVPPTLVSARADATGTHLIVRFSEPVLADGATDGFNYSLNPADAEVGMGVMLDERTVLLPVVNGTLTPGASYTLHVEGVEDLAHNAITPVDSTPFPRLLVTNGVIKLEIWDNLLGGSFAAWTNHPGFPDNPTSVVFTNSSITPDNRADRYVLRLSGYFVPPETANYTFQVVADDSAWLLMGLDPADPLNLTTLVRAEGVCAACGGLQSQPVRLIGGLPYYFSAIMVELWSGDYLRVFAKDDANIPNFVPADGSVLLYAYDPNQLHITQQPANFTLPILPSTGQLTTQDFESGNGGFIVKTVGQVGKPWAYSAGSWIVSDTPDSPGPYRNSKLISPPFKVLTAGELTLSFNHRHSFEDGAWDGGQVHISVNGGPFTVVNNFTANGYNGQVDPGSNNDFQGQDAFINQSADYANGTFITSTATLGTFNQNDVIILRFVAAYDDCCEGTEPNWQIDSLSFSSQVEQLPVQQATFSVAAAAAGAPVVYQWQRYNTTSSQWENLTIETANTPTLQLQAIQGLDDGAQFRCLVGMAGGQVTVPSSVATLNFVNDTVAPTLVSVTPSVSPDKLYLRFSEALSPASATAVGNYSITAPEGTVTVQQAVLAADGSTVVLYTTPHVPAKPYSITVQNVADLSGNIMASSSLSYTSAIVINGLARLQRYSGTCDAGIFALYSSPYYPFRPDLDTFTTILNYAPNLDCYGTRMFGYFVPPQTGNYQFFTSSDDNSEVWLSTDETAANLQLVANEGGCCGGYVNNVANSTRTLQAGRLYYYEVRHKEGGGGDYVRVTYSLNGVPADPNNPPAPPISGNVLALAGPYGAGPTTITIAQQPSNVSTGLNSRAILSVQATGSSPTNLAPCCADLIYQWQRLDPVSGLFTNVPGANSATYITGYLSANEDGSVWRCQIANPNGSLAMVYSDTATITVLVDTVLPFLEAARADVFDPTHIILTFSEPMNTNTMGDSFNYTVTPEKGVTQVILPPDGITAILVLDNPLDAGVAYTVTVETFLEDLAGNYLDPNRNSISGIRALYGGHANGLRYDRYTGTDASLGSLTNNLAKWPNNDLAEVNQYVNTLAFATEGGDTYNNYAVHIYGILVPSVSGTYRFQLHSDDNSVVFLSSNADPTNKFVLVNEPSCCAYRESGTVSLQAGQWYWVEAFMSEGGGGDYITVRWRNEDLAESYNLIPSSNLLYVLNPDWFHFLPQPASISVIEGRVYNMQAPMTANFQMPNQYQYQWQRYNTALTQWEDIPGATGVGYSSTAAYPADNGAQFRCKVTVGGAFFVYSPVTTLTVLEDTVPPVVESVRADPIPGTVVVKFDGPVDSASASDTFNYAVTTEGGDIGPTTAVLEPDNMTVYLMFIDPNTSNPFVFSPYVTYTLKVSGVQDAFGNSTAYTEANFSGWAVYPGIVRQSIYLGNSGGNFWSTMSNNVKFPYNPDIVNSATTLDYPQTSPNVDNYSYRVNGWFVAPETADYWFQIWSDDSGWLMLSTDAMQSNKLTLIRYENWCCQNVNTESFPGYCFNQPVHLIGGRAYYIEGLFQEGGGGDGFTAWYRNNASVPTFTSFSSANLLVAINSAEAALTRHPSNTTVLDGAVATFDVGVNREFYPIAYQWQKKRSSDPDFSNIAGANSISYTTPSLSIVTDNGNSYRCIVSYGGGLYVVTSAVATVTITPDTTPPTLTSVAAPDPYTVILTFSKRLLPSTATNLANYTFTPSLVVDSAVLDPNGMTVYLNTRLQLPGQTYDIQVSDIQDATIGHNLISPNPSTGQFTSKILAGGAVLFQRYDNIGGGTAVSDLTSNPKFPNSPDYTATLFEMYIPSQGDQWGGRLTGYFLPPQTGNYTFYTSSDDASQVFLSTDSNPANKVMVAREDGCCHGYVNNISGSTKYLYAGRLYYIEALVKEGGGGDYLDVGYQYGSGGIQRIRKAQLGSISTVGTSNAFMVVTRQPAARTYLAGQYYTNSVQVLIVPTVLTNYVRYQWQRNGVDIPGANSDTLVYGPLSVVGNNGDVFRCVVSTIGAGVLTDDAPLTVNPAELDPPTLVSTWSLGTIYLKFNETLYAPIANQTANYSVTFNGMFPVIQPSDTIVGSSGNTPPNEGVANVIDNNVNTKYLNFDGPGSGFTVTIGAPAVVRAIRLTSANDSPGRDPATYVIEGSTDGNTFTVIASGEVPVFSGRFTSQYIGFENSTPYSIYRVTFPTLRGDSMMQLAECQLFRLAGNEPVNVTSAALQADGMTVAVEVDRTAFGTYTVNYANVKDVSGNTVVPGSASMRYWHLRSIDSSQMTDGDPNDPNPPGVVTTYDANSFDVSVGGSDIWNNRDGINFIYQRMVGDFDVKARLEELVQRDYWGKAGIMMRQQLAAPSRHITIAATPTGNGRYQAVYRDSYWGGSGVYNEFWSVSYPNTWVRFTRSGGQFAVYASSDAVNWNQVWIGSDSSYPNEVFVGLATTSHSQGNATTARFRNVAGFNPRPLFFREPDTTTLYQAPGSSFTLSGSAYGWTVPVRYQWRLNGVGIPGATNDTINVTNFDVSKLGTYTLVAINDDGETVSHPVVVNEALPEITAQPQRTSAGVGGSGQFSVTVSSVTQPTYQWYHEGQPIAGANSAILTVENAQFADGGNYYVVVGNTVGSVTSQVAILDIIPVANPVQGAGTEDQTAQIILDGMGMTGRTLTFTLVSGPRHGTVTIANGIATYIPDPLFNGRDTFEYTVSDGVNTSEPATVTVDVAFFDNVKPYAFTNAVTFPAGTSPRALAVIDLKKDLRIDLAVADYTAHAINLLTNDGFGTFTMADQINVGGKPVSVQAVDVNKDGVQDLVVAVEDEVNSGVEVYTNVQKTGQFALAQRIDLGANAPAYVAVADVAKDGLQDILVVEPTAGQVAVYKNDTGSSWSWVTNVPAGSNPRMVAVGTLNKDTLLDIAVVNDAGVSVFMGRGNGQFSNAVNYAVGTDPFAVVLADFNGDKKLDIAVANSGSDDVTVLTNILNGVFTNAGSFGVGFSIGQEPSALVAAELNKDGKPDLAVALAGVNSVEVMLGRGTNSLGPNGQPIFTYYWGDPGAFYAVGDTPVGIVAADLNKDMLVDVATANMESGDVSVLLNNLTPLAYKQKLTLLEDVPTNITLHASFGPLSYVITQYPTNGSWTTTNSLDNTTNNPVGLYTPNQDFFGNDTILFQVTDGFKTSKVAQIAIKVLPVNDQPSFELATNQVVSLEDKAVVFTNFIVNLVKGPANERLQTVKYYVVADNTNLFAGKLGQPTIMGTNLKYTPAKNVYGRTTVRIWVQDSGKTLFGGVDAANEQVFDIEIVNVNDVPVISRTLGRTIFEDRVANFVFMINDLETAPDDLLFSVSSTNVALLPDNSTNIVVVRNGTNVVVKVYPVADMYGKTLLTFTVDDGTNSASVTGLLTVNPVNDAPSFELATTEIVVGTNVNASYTNHVINVQSAGPNEVQGLKYVIVNNSNPGLFATQPAINALTGNLTFKVKGGTVTGTAVLTIRLTDLGGVLNTGVNASAEQQLTIIVQP